MSETQADWGVGRLDDLLDARLAANKNQSETKRFDKADPMRGGGRWFGAAWPGECSGCGRDYEAGTEIRWDGEGGYECCTEIERGDSVLSPEPERKSSVDTSAIEKQPGDSICPVCYLVKPKYGECCG